MDLVNPSYFQISDSLLIISGLNAEAFDYIKASASKYFSCNQKISALQDYDYLGYRDLDLRSQGLTIPLQADVLIASNFHRDFKAIAFSKKRIYSVGHTRMNYVENGSGGDKHEIYEFSAYVPEILDPISNCLYQELLGCPLAIPQKHYQLKNLLGIGLTSKVEELIGLHSQKTLASEYANSLIDQIIYSEVINKIDEALKKS